VLNFKLQIVIRVQKVTLVSFKKFPNISSLPYRGSGAPVEPPPLVLPQSSDLCLRIRFFVPIPDS